jgi:hypothetical protein
MRVFLPEALGNDALEADLCLLRGQLAGAADELVPD